MEKTIKIGKRSYLLTSDDDYLCEDIEFRVWVEEGSDLSVSMLEVIPE